MGACGIEAWTHQLQEDLAVVLVAAVGQSQHEVRLLVVLELHELAGAHGGDHRLGILLPLALDLLGTEALLQLP